MQFADLHVALAGYDAPFSRRMTLHFGAWAADAQIFCRKFVAFSRIETDNKNLAILTQAQFCRPSAAICHKIHRRWEPKLRSPAIASAAEYPAVLPNTAPDMSPVPPG